MNQIFILFVCLMAVVTARKSLRDSLTKWPSIRNEYIEGLVNANASCNSKTTVGNIEYPWATYHFNVKLDHFTFSDTRTFPMKYLLNNCYYKPGGPIFFYTGNEGDIEGFATATGMMWDLAPQFNAAIIFAEHRFYGTSLPFGEESFTSLKNMGYLTSEQALADYADFLIQLKSPNNNLPLSYASSTPVIAFGGSYGGMLAAWFRMKYPHLVSGSWASSAPLLYVKNGGIDVGTFDKITTRTYNNSGCNYYILENCWNAILRLSNTTEGRQFLNSNMNLANNTQIESVNDGWNLNSYIREGIEYMAMVDYPYPTNFLTPMPGDPVVVACQMMNAPGTNFTDEQLAMMVYNASQVYYNSDGSNVPYCIDPSQCGDPATASLGSALGWPWQECSEIIMEMCSQGPPNDMFWNECGDDLDAMLAEGCASTFGFANWTTDDWNIRAIETRFGLLMPGHSNIILTQGHLDPWSGGGYAPNAPGVSYVNGIYVVDIPGSAHHLDLRLPNTCDPNTLSNIRYQIVNILQSFIRSDGKHPALTPLPALQTRTIPDSGCKDISGGYPWGQTPEFTTAQTTVGSTAESSTEVATAEQSTIVTTEALTTSINIEGTTELTTSVVSTVATTAKQSTAHTTQATVASTTKTTSHIFSALAFVVTLCGQF